MKTNSLLIIVIIIIVAIGSIRLLNKTNYEKNMAAEEDSVSPIIDLTYLTNNNKRVLNGKVILVKGEAFEVGNTAKATDNVDGDISNKIAIDGNVDTDNVGEYTVKYSVEDNNHNRAELEQTFEVREEQKNGLPVLMYHFFYSKDDPNYAGKTPDNNLLMVEKFSEQMQYLVDDNYYYPSWQEVIDYVDGKSKLPEKSVVLTDDDGNHTFFALAVPVLEEKKIPMTSFVITSDNGDRLSEKYEYVNYQSHSEKMHAAGGNGKGAMVTWSYDQILQDLQTSKNKIETVTGGKCNVFCYPFGHYNDVAIKALTDANFDLAFTVEGGRVKVGANKLKLPRVRINGNTTISQFKEAVK